LEGATLTVMFEGAGDVIVTLAAADSDRFACKTAVTETTEGFGTAFGAVKRPEAEMVPTAALPPVAPFTFHATRVLEVPVTVAENRCVRPTATDAEEGETTTVGDPPPELVMPAHPLRVAAKTKIRTLETAFIAFSSLDSVVFLRLAFRVAERLASGAPKLIPSKKTSKPHKVSGFEEAVSGD
jgi:hypothetical protein